MIPNDAKRQEAYALLRKLTSDRIARALGLAAEDLVNLSLSQIINLIFLIHGDSGSTGNFNGSFSAVLELIGAELLWHGPEIEKVSVGPFVQ